MAIQLSKIEGYLNEMGINFDRRDDETVIFPLSDEGEKIIVITKLLEDGEYIQMRTLEHLDKLVAEAAEDKRVDLLKWMLEQNYKTKLGSWEYDPSDHDHHFAIGHSIEDGDITIKQFMRMFKNVGNTLNDIPKMKEILGVPGMSEKDKKRQELLAQLKALDEDGGI